jgi:hypothetical protein
MKTLLKTAIPLLLVVSGATSCSKKDGAGEASTKAAVLTHSLLDEDLLKEIPNATAGFVVMDFAGEGYKKFKESPWANDVQGLSAIKAAVEELESQGASDDQVKLARTILDSLQKLGLVSPDGKAQVEKVFSKSVGFVETRAGEQVPVSFGVFLSAAAGTNLGDRLPVLKQIATDAGLTVADETFGAARGFSASLPKGPEGDSLPLALYVAATPERLGLTLSKSSLEPLFTDASTKGLETLRALPEFKKAEEAVRASEPPLSFAFVSLKSLSPALESLNEGSEPESKIDFKQNPLEAIAINQGFSGQMVTLAGVAVSPVTETQKTVISAFANSSLPGSAFKLPTKTAFSLSLDAKVLGKLESVFKSLPDPSVAVAVEQLKNIQGITLGLRPGDGTSPAPDLFISLESASRDQVASVVQDGLGMGMMAAGQQAQWLSKEIDGSPTKYFMTMIGVGVYVSSPKGTNTVLVGTSEGVIKDALTSAPAQSVETKLTQSRLAPASIGALYLNFDQLATLIDSVKSTVAMFAGPNPELDKALDTSKLKTFGVGVGSLSYADGVFKLQSSFERQALATK